MARHRAACALAPGTDTAFPERVTPTFRLALLPLLILAGCSTTERATLHVDIANIATTDATAGDGEAVFTLRIANEALYPMVVESDTHKITVDGAFLCEASSKETYALVQLGIVSHDVRAPITDGAMAERIREIVRRGGGTYQIESRFKTNAAGDYIYVSNRTSGTFALKGK